MLNRTLKDIKINDKLFGGTLLVLSSDFIHTLPIIPRLKYADEINTCLKSSPLRCNVEKVQLKINMFIHMLQNPSAETFSKQLLNIGDGKVAMWTEMDDGTGYVKLPTKRCLFVVDLSTPCFSHGQLYVAWSRDANISWNTENPEFTSCFEKTVLIWIPCSYLWLTAFLDAYYIFNSKERNIPWNILNISKLVITFLLIVLKFVDLGVTVHKSSKDEAVFNADYYAPVVMILTFVLSAKLLYYNKMYGMRVSGVLFFFWLLLILAGISQLRSEMVTHHELKEDEHIQYNFVSYMIYYPLIILMFILNCFVDLPPKNSPYNFEQNPCPKNASGFPSRLTFSWFDPIVFTGFRRSLTEKDLWSLNPEDSSKVVVPRFIQYWERILQKKEISNSLKATQNTSTYARVNFKSDQESKPASILPVLCFVFGRQFLFGALLNLINDVLMFLSPQLLKLLIEFIDSKEPVWKGYLYVGGLFACATIQTLLSTHFYLDMYLVGMKIRTALTSAIYRKSLRISNSARKQITVGEIVNLIAVDAQRFLELTVILNMVWSAPLQIALSIYFLWGILGPSVLAGLAIMIILIPINGVIASRMEKNQLKQMKYKDERVKLMNEVLNGIKVLKMNAWELSFEEQILKIRNKEIFILKQIAYLKSTMSFLFFSTPFLVSLMSFGCFVLVNDKEVLDSKRAFVSLSLFNILRLPLAMLPNVISNVVQTLVSIKRLNIFMNFEELNQNCVEHDPKESNPIVIEKGHFTWSDDSEPVLKNINLHIQRGGLVAVVGAVGSGKSSLLSALLGEMNKISGRVNTTGTIAYVPQQAWIQNATLQDNIVFGRKLEKVKYKNVINVCALKPDFDILPGGDQTEIGEKGINLSGGQKQRVSLARAVYYDADNYFLDDPLSAVDSHVGKHIFDKVIGPNGLLKNKTRVWVTHNVSYLAQTDLVVVLKDGEMSEAGSYQQLLEKKGAFADFLLHHLSDAERTSEEWDEIKQELESELGSEYQNKLQRSRSLFDSIVELEQVAAGERRNSVKKCTLKSTPNEMKEKNKLIDAEKTETAKVKWIVYKHYLTSMGVRTATVTVLMNLMMQVFQICSNYWLSKWSNDNQMVVNGTVEVKRRDLFLGVYGGLGIGQAVTSFLSDLMPHLACWRAAKILHEILLTRVFRSPLKFFEVTPIGRILSRFSKDVDIMDTSLPTEVTNVMFCIFEVLGTLFVISYSTPIFLTVVLPIGIVYYVIQRFYVATSRQLKRLESVSRSPIYSHFGESINGAQTIRAYGFEERFIEESERLVDFNQSFYYPSIIAHRWLAIRLEMVGNLIIFFSALFVVLGRDTINPGIVGISVTYALQITQTLNFLVRMTSEIETNIIAVERIKEYSDIKEEAPWTVSVGPGPKWPENGALQLENLSLGYRTGEPTLRDLTCFVAPRDKLGIVGRTGAGKSTLTLGLFRIVEAMSGRILIDGIDIATIGLHQLRSRITIIPQDPVLFAGTLRMNLDPFEAFGDDDVWSALEHVHLKAFAKGLQAGLMHEITEGGENLSVGQRQLVCLARALLRKTSLLVLDEATAAIDLETDDLIQKTIRTEFASCTVLTIAHRLNTIMDSTRVLVLDKGQLVEYAPPEQLLQDKNSIFYSMAQDAGLVN